jgi:uncharacterized protein YecE (DUF72 family)
VDSVRGSVTQYLVGTGGWAYFNVPNKLKSYSQIFNFTEVNYTFYEYPETRRVEMWRRTVPKDFVFSVRCHQDLTHRIGLKPVEEAYRVFDQMVSYCRILDAPFLVLETPASCVLDEERLKEAREFLSIIDSKGVRLIWEVRAPNTTEITRLMQEFSVVHCVDLSREKPSFNSDVVYTRLFGKGKHNIYQFTDEELIEIDNRATESKPKIAAMSYHGLRMNTDAIRFNQYKSTGTFPLATSFTGADSAKQVMSEDAKFPSSKAELAEHQGWKVIDLTSNRRVHLSELLSKIPDKTYSNLNEVMKALKVD